MIGTFSGSLRILSHLAPGHHGINMNVLEKKVFCNCVELDPIMFDFEAGSGHKPCQSSRSLGGARASGKQRHLRLFSPEYGEFLRRTFWWINIYPQTSDKIGEKEPTHSESSSIPGVGIFPRPTRWCNSTFDPLPVAINLQSLLSPDWGRISWYEMEHYYSNYVRHCLFSVRVNN